MLLATVTIKTETVSNCSPPCLKTEFGDFVRCSCKITFPKGFPHAGPFPVDDRPLKVVVKVSKQAMIIEVLHGGVRGCGGLQVLARTINVTLLVANKTSGAQRVGSSCRRVRAIFRRPPGRRRERRYCKEPKPDRCMHVYSWDLAGALGCNRRWLHHCYPPLTWPSRGPSILGHSGGLRPGSN